MNVLVKLAELPYRGVNRLRRALYRAGILRAKRLGKPVISVGNISAGGAGKTPAVIAIARHLSAKGLHVAVLTRGYKRSGAGGVVVALDPVRFGDEPVLIKRSTLNVDVIVGVNRFLNASLVNADVYLLDDGFQHLQLHRDLDVVIESPRDRFHREGISALRDADIVLPRRIRATNLDAVRGRKVFAFSGLADNEQFFSMVRLNGVELTGTRPFPDHHAYTDVDLREIRQAGRGADAIVTTEKDWVKVRADDIIPIAIEFEIPPEALARIDAVVSQHD